MRARGRTLGTRPRERLATAAMTTMGQAISHRLKQPRGQCRPYVARAASVLTCASRARG